MPDVLLVEDDDDLREDLAFMMTHRGFSVATAANGKEALAQLREGRTPCLILLDLMMPIMDGWTFHDELLKEPAWADIPVVLLSGILELQKEAQALKTVGCIRKPIDLDKLCEMVQAHC